MNRKFFRHITYYLEHIIFPVVFLIFAAMMASSFVDALQMNRKLDLIGFSQLVRYVFLFFFNILIAYFLYMTKSNTKVYPDRMSEVIVPIIATFWFFTYSLVEMIPTEINKFFIPQAWVEFLIPIGILVNLIGHGVSIAGVLSLKQSFGIVTKVSEIITTGLYGVVRHPIYFGYLVMTIGFVCMTPKLIHFIVYTLSIVIQVWRAKIEESKLAASSEEYKKYMKNVPFLVPNFKKLLLRKN